MSQAEKAAYWRELKDAGVEFSRHYREYTTEQLQEAVITLRKGLAEQQARQVPPSTGPESVGIQLPTTVAPRPAGPVERDSIAGLRLNTQDEDEPLRVDPDGTIWYQDEVNKPAFPKPRGRRVLKYEDPGVRTETVRGPNGVSESFEMPGEERRISEARITLPSYQVGIYRRPEFPFKIHEYAGARGFDLFEVEEFYGGADLVPTDIQRVYVSTSLCYDIRTTVRAIEKEARELALKEKAGIQ